MTELTKKKILAAELKKKELVAKADDLISKLCKFEIANPPLENGHTVKNKKRVDSMSNRIYAYHKKISELNTKILHYRMEEEVSLSTYA